MSKLSMYSVTNSDLEEFADNVKAMVCTALVKDKLLTPLSGEDWAKEHTIILRSKTIFHTISDLWKKEKESDNFIMMIVKSV